MFYDRHLGYSEAHFDALNRARISKGLEPYQPNRSQTAALTATLLIVALLMMLLT